jgi:hypothetical protein
VYRKQVVSKSRGELMRSVNEGIALVAASLPVDPAEAMVWAFACECGEPECTAWVELELEGYRAIRDAPDRHVLAAGHVLRARRARARSRALQAEAQALRAQTEQLLRRTGRPRRPAGDGSPD